MQKKIYLFYLGLALCVLGWIFLGLGVVLFPLSIYLLMYARVYHIGFWIMMVFNIIGFSLSFYADMRIIFNILI